MTPEEVQSVWDQPKPNESQENQPPAPSSSSECTARIQVKYEYRDTTESNEAEAHFAHSAPKKRKSSPDVPDCCPSENVSSPDDTLTAKRISRTASNIQAEAGANEVRTEAQGTNDTGLLATIKQENPEPEDDDNRVVGLIEPVSPADVKPAVKVEKEEATSSTSRVSCQFGIRCYRQNPLHYLEEAHPGDKDYTRPNFPPPPDGTPDCPYGDLCYRRNPVHFQQYSHPPSTDFKQNYINYRLRLRQRRQQEADPNADLTEFDDSEDPFINDDSEDEYIPDSNDKEEEED